MNDIPLCANGHPMEVTSCANAAEPKPYSCAGTRCPAKIARTMDNAPHYFICAECSSALCPRCAVDQSQIYKMLLTIDQMEADMLHNKTPFVKEGTLTKKGMGRMYRPWAERNFILDSEGTLGYYQSGEMRGAINVKGSSIRILRSSEADGRNFAFSLVSPQVIHQGSLFNAGELILAAKTMEEAASWCASLQLAIREAAGESAGFVRGSNARQSDLEKDGTAQIVRRPSASGGLMASPEAMAAKVEPPSSVQLSHSSGREVSGSASGLLAAAASTGRTSMSQTPAQVRAAMPATSSLKTSRAASVKGKTQSTAETELMREMVQSVYSGVRIDKKFSSESSYKSRLVWLDQSAKTLNWSKQEVKSDNFKCVDLVSISSCVREAPKRMPIGIDTVKVEGLCLTLTVDKRLASRAVSADVKGDGIDLRFSSESLAQVWVDTLNKLRADASAIFTGVRVDKKFSTEANYKTRLVWLDETAKTFNWSKEAHKSEHCKFIHLATVAECTLALPDKASVIASRTKNDGLCVRIQMETSYTPRDRSAEVKGDSIDLRFFSVDAASNFVETFGTLRARAIAARAK